MSNFTHFSDEAFEFFVFPSMAFRARRIFLEFCLFFSEKSSENVFRRIDKANLDGEVNLGLDKNPSSARKSFSAYQFSFTLSKQLPNVSQLCSNFKSERRTKKLYAK